MPLTIAGADDEPAGSEAHAEARKIRPDLARGPLVRVAVARNLAEGELIRGVLLEQGIPSMLRRTIGFDVPDFLAAGPRDVLVPEQGVPLARELLSDIDETEAASRLGAERDGPAARGYGFKATAWFLAALLGSGTAVALLYVLVR